jgi:nitric-oxide synthase
LSLNSREGHATIHLQLNTLNPETLKYKPGDHLAVFPRNNRDMMQRFVLRLRNCPASKSATIQLQVQGPNGNRENWKRIPPCSFDNLLARFIDLTSPPSQTTLRLMASSAIDQKDKMRLEILAEVYYYGIEILIKV